ncbi:hypothetical protein PQR62_04420 [Herbaspirillum lusitanum]|uniref:Teneurin-like YD-shell domain-containing protein n=1 Tax=Herbaspirillum lusitanum TaxID=213312 RepID=A0ABW9A539_9BURK
METNYTYDIYGNKVAIVTSSTATGTATVAPRTYSSTYDANGQFPVVSSNALSQSETRSYDARFGRINSLVGPNGLKTQWQYDGFGRQIKEIRADGTQTKWEYLYCAGINNGTVTCPKLASYVIVTTHLASDGERAIAPWSKIYFDSLNREVKTETVGFDGSSIVVEDTQYDNLGRVSRTSLPYYSHQTVQWRTLTYDALNRVVVATAPDGSQNRMAYNGLATTVTNALNQTQTKVKNSQGQVIKVTDAQSNNLTYQYDAIGNLTATTDPKGNVVAMSYDLRGRKTGMVDPDMGAWSYVYNGFGELVRQTDAKGQVSTISYDKLGRMNSRSEPDLVSTWLYDSCAKGIGKLCRISSDNGYQKTNSYDSLGRNVSTSTNIDAAYSEGVSYDPNGRITTQTYPTGLVIRYVYTSLGYLKEVRNNQTDALLWRADTQNAMGQILQQTYGNNVVTQQVFEASTGRLKNVYAGAGNSVQNFSYQYDQLGNLVSRADGNQSLTETFLYDSLNRVTNAVVNSPQAGLASTNYSYDAVGNITNRSDLGTYVYGPANGRPHALKELNFIHGGKLQYNYDANGALISEVAVDSTGAVIADRGRNETYTSYGMLKTVNSPSVGLSFVYGPDHQRIKQVAPSATTIYLNPDNTGGLFYEKDIKADGSTEHKHYITAGGAVIALIKQTGATQVINYMHRDQLGSTTTITDGQGNVMERLAYEPFGKRRLPGGATDAEGAVVGVNTDRGFTNHEHLEELGLIHMNGRVYDPALGRFMSADPNIQAPFDIQSHNRYAYVLNRPLHLVDPSGYLPDIEVHGDRGGRSERDIPDRDRYDNRYETRENPQKQAAVAIPVVPPPVLLPVPVVHDFHYVPGKLPSFPPPTTWSVPKINDLWGKGPYLVDPRMGLLAAINSLAVAIAQSILAGNGIDSGGASASPPPEGEDGNSNDKQKKGKPERNVDQNKQVNDAGRDAKLNSQQRKDLGRAVEYESRAQGSNLGYKDIREIAELIKKGQY